MSFNKVIQRLDVFRVNVDKATREALEEAAHRVKEEAEAIIAEEAYDTGALMLSGRVTRSSLTTSGNKERLSRTVEFGGKTRAGRTVNAPRGVVEYAAVVHEVGTGGQGPAVRFLTRAIQQVQREIMLKFKVAYKRWFRSA